MRIKGRSKWQFLWGNILNPKFICSSQLALISISLKKTKTNVNFAVRYLIQNNIEYEIHDMPKGKIAEQTIDFAQKLNADLILIVTTKNITFADYMLGASEQQIIANSSKIPVCCVNPLASFTNVGQFMGGWGS